MKGLENIDLPENIDEITSDAIEKGEKYRKSNKKRKISMIAASFVAFMIIGTSIGSNGVKAAIEGLTNKIETYFDGRFNTEPIKDYKASLGITSESNGVKVTVNEFFMDNESLYINANFQSENGHNVAQNIDYEVSLNGKELDKATSGGQTYKFNEDNSTDVLIRKDIDKVELKDITDIRLKIDGISYFKVKDKTTKNLNGYWDFNFKFDGAKAASQIIDKDVNKIIAVNDLNMTIKSIKVTPMKVSVKYAFDKEEDSEKGEYVGVGVLDEKGELVTLSEGHGNGEETVYNIILDTRNMNEITIVPIKTMGSNEPYVYMDKVVKVKIK